MGKKKDRLVRTLQERANGELCVMKGSSIKFDPSDYDDARPLDLQWRGGEKVAETTVGTMTRMAVEANERFRASGEGRTAINVINVESLLPKEVVACRA